MPAPLVANPIGVSEAIGILDAIPVHPVIEPVPLDRARGRRLAEPLRADRDAPPFDKSLMDGFAVRLADTFAPNARLRVVAEIAAGGTPARSVAAGEAHAIMTGAPLPDGADAILPIERTEESPDPSGERWIIAHRPAEARFIARRGSDVHAGKIVLETGSILHAAPLAVAAGVGASRVAVFARLRAGILTTGDEIVPFTATPAGSQIRNSNSIMLASLLAGFGCEVEDLGHVRDDPARIQSAIEEAMRCDALFITGGMSMGEYDFVPRILRRIGVDLKIARVRIKPGKPFFFGVGRGEPGRLNPPMIFGLPGNPVSGFVCTVRLAGRLIRRMMGGSADEGWIEATLTAPLPANGDREFYQPAVLDADRVTPLAWKGSADIFTLAGANCLLVRAENAPAQPAGTRATVLTF